jgi:hypothetical protein
MPLSAKARCPTGWRNACELRPDVWLLDDLTGSSGPANDSQKETTMEQKKKFSLKKWWKEARPTKSAVFWLLLASAILTIVVGFVWGGWTTGAAAQRLATETATDAVVDRLALICTTQFDQDPGKVEKLEELRKVSGYRKRIFVEDQGWATMPGEERLTRGVAEECARLLLLDNS